MVADFEGVKEQFILNVKAVVEMEEIPPQLIFNWDQTGVLVWDVPPLTCPPGQYSLGNFVPPDIIHWWILSPQDIIHW